MSAKKKKKKDRIRILMGNALNLHITLSNTVTFTNKSAKPRTQDIFSFICIFSNFFQQCFVVFRVQVFYLLG